MNVVVIKPCEVCDTLVEDVDDPNFKGQWLCYTCHCHKTGRPVKEALNALATLFKRLHREKEKATSVDQAVDRVLGLE